MAVHIGTLIKETMEMRGVTVIDTAEKLGIHRNSLHRILQQQSVDTDVLLRLSRILSRDFFRPYSEEIAGEQVSEPAAPYGAKKRGVTRVIIEMSDDSSSDAKDAAISIVERLRKGSE